MKLELHVDSANVSRVEIRRRRASFEVVGYSSVTIRTPRGGHSDMRADLIHCGIAMLKILAIFRWYETQGLHDQRVDHSSQFRVYPFALKPGRDAYSALSRCLHDIGTNQRGHLLPVDLSGKRGRFHRTLDGLVRRWAGKVISIIRG